MKPSLITLALSAMLLNTAPVVANDTQHFIAVTDISNSSSLLINEAFSKAAIKRIKAEITSLKKGTWVELRTFGDGQFESFNRKTRISNKRNTPAYVANLVGTEISKIKAEIKGGQSSTNMVAFLELEELHCDTGISHIYIVSDAIEHSLDISAKNLLNGSKSLPEPNHGLLRGCKVTIVGLGNVSGNLLPRNQRKNLEAAWRKWFAVAGVEGGDLKVIYRP